MNLSLVDFSYSKKKQKTKKTHVLKSCYFLLVNILSGFPDLKKILVSLLFQDSIFSL